LKDLKTILLKTAGRLGRKDPRFLIVNPFGIGDVLFTTPVIKAIKRKYPASFIGYWCNERVKPILESNPQIDKVVALSRGDLKRIYSESFFKGLWAGIKLAWRIKRRRFDVCFDFSLDHRYSLLAKLLGIKQRIGFNYRNRGRFLTRSIDIEGYYGKHVIDYYLELLKFLDIPVFERDMYLVSSPGAQARSKAIVSGAGIAEGDLVIGVAPGGGGSWGKDAVYKRWSPYRFAEVANKLIEKFNAKVIVIGDESERKITDVVVHMMRNKPIDLTGKVALDILPGIIKRCDLFISNDGGPMHMAVALGVKTISIFGPVSETVYGPYPVKWSHIVVKNDISCRPCYANFKFPGCNRDKECLNGVSAEAVFKAAEVLLK
jgi:ADP-heptose:LPS heptosyltransferase